MGREEGKGSLKILSNDWIIDYSGVWIESGSAPYMGNI